METPLSSKVSTAKILIIGDSQVGKTSILTRFTDDTFQPETCATVGVDFRSKTVPVKGRNIDLEIWDTGGQERFRAITRNFYRQCMGVILVFDLTNRESFKNLTGWLEQLNLEADDDIAKVVIGNKLDLDRKVEVEEIQDLLEPYNLPYFETSAMTGGNIGFVFTYMATIIADMFLCSKSRHSTVDLTATTANESNETIKTCQIIKYLCAKTKKETDEDKISKGGCCS